jgi:hypothetical protein
VTFNLPSGASVELRPITVAEENMLAGMPRGGSMEQVMDALLTACCRRVVTPGPYPGLLPDAQPAWENMLQGDRFFALIALRSISYRDGAVYEFDSSCPCGVRVPWEVNLLEDLYIQKLPEPSAAKLRTGELFTTTLREVQVSFHLDFGRDSVRAEKLTTDRPDRKAAIGLWKYIAAVEGVDQAAVLDWLSDLTAGEAQELRETFTEVDCGVDSDVEIQCQRCGKPFVVALPFEEFFVRRPSSARRRRTSRRSG